MGESGILKFSLVKCGVVCNCVVKDGVNIERWRSWWTIAPTLFEITTLYISIT